ncbi:hypothetical protein LJR219_000306 [Phenylobacterium sp. LjRoot219]|uniref:hypothetical protein n=1 Tax=Phenylobacterium sp. LjRoot219 TaxID=3342283 RepID=UPI003ECCC530
MTAIRPNLPSLGHPAATPQPAGARSAARAFFDLAAGNPPAASSAAASAAAPVQKRVQAPVEPPARPLRPGSLLDIRV